MGLFFPKISRLFLSWTAVVWKSNFQIGSSPLFSLFQAGSEYAPTENPDAQRKERKIAHYSLDIWW